MAVIPGGFAVVPGGGQALIDFIPGAANYIRDGFNYVMGADASNFESGATRLAVSSFQNGMAGAVAAAGVGVPPAIGFAAGVMRAAYNQGGNLSDYRNGTVVPRITGPQSVPLLTYNSTPADPLIDPRPGGGHVYMNFMGNRGAGRRGIVRFVRHRGRRQFSHRFRDNYGQYDSRARDGFSSS